MKSTFILSLLAATAFAPAALAQQTQQPAQAQQQQQPQTEAQAPGQAGSCDRLIAMLQQNPNIDSPVTLDQARQFKNQNNLQACRQANNRIRQTAGQQQTEIHVQQQAPRVKVDRAPLNVRVQQPQPQVNVVQAQPQITIRQAPPTITVQQPQPEIIVRMPEPEVNVSMPQPRVSVDRPPIDVTTLPPEQRGAAQAIQQAEQVPPKVTVQRAAPVEPHVQLSGRPSLRFEQTGEPRVVYQRAEGQPRVRVEPMQQAQQNRQQQRMAGQQNACNQLVTMLQQNPDVDSPVTLTRAREYQQQGNQRACRQAMARIEAAGDEEQTQAQQAVGQSGTTGVAAPQATRRIAVTELLDDNLYNARGQSLGDVERVVVSLADNQQYIVIGHGGILGLGEKQVAIPLSNVYLVGDRLTVRGLSEAQIEAMPEWNWDRTRFRELSENQFATVGAQ